MPAPILVFLKHRLANCAQGDPNVIEKRGFDDSILRSERINRASGGQSYMPSSMLARPRRAARRRARRRVSLGFS